MQIFTEFKSHSTTHNYVEREDMRIQHACLPFETRCCCLRHLHQSTLLRKVKKEKQ